MKIDRSKMMDKVRAISTANVNTGLKIRIRD